MLNLLSKDIKLLFGSKKSVKERAFAVLLFAFLLVSLVVLETLLYVNILKRISSFNNAPIAFTTLFLFIISLLIIVISLFTERKLFYEEEDKEKMALYPLPYERVIASKLVLLFFTNYLLTLALTYPLFVAYGMNVGALPAFYFVALFYPVLTFFFECGVSMLLLAPFNLFLNFLDKHKIIEYVLASLLLAGATYAYGRVLLLFLDLIGENSLSRLFSTSSIASLMEARKYFIIVNYLTNIYFLGSFSSFLYALGFSLPTFILGLILTVVLYRHQQEGEKESKKKSKKHVYHQESMVKALFKKEFIVFFRDNENLFSFSSLLLIAPYLLYLVILALNTIFTSGTVGYYLGFIKEFVPATDIAVISLFAITLLSGADDYLSREGSSLKVMKCLPIKPRMIIAIKMMIPLSLSSFSLLVGLVVMYSLKTITLTTFLLSLLFALSSLLSYSIVTFFAELKQLKKGGRVFSTLYELLPIVILVYMAVLSAYGFSSFFLYLTSSIFTVLVTVILLLLFLKKEEDMFVSLEVAA